jgi:hypothetical protein
MKTVLHETVLLSSGITALNLREKAKKNVSPKLSSRDEERRARLVMLPSVYGHHSLGLLGDCPGTALNLKAHQAKNYVFLFHMSPGKTSPPCSISVVASPTPTRL